MNILVTAGSTTTPIDQVRVISNIFRGRTGTAIAEHFAAAGHSVTLLTSAPYLIKDNSEIGVVIRYSTFDELDKKMGDLLPGSFDVVIHSSAVNDFEVGRSFLRGEDGELIDVSHLGKIPSGKPLLLEMVPTHKIVDRIRGDWEFDGVLVKFKLEVDISDEELLGRANPSRVESGADIIVANNFEWSRESAYILDKSGNEIKQNREDLPALLLEAVCRSLSVSPAA